MPEIKRKLGKLAPKHDHRTLKLANYLKPLPNIPLIESWMYKPENDPNFNWGMLKNDELGDCAIAGPAHIQMVWSINSGANVPAPTEHQVVQEYTNVSGYNPNDPNSDNGCVMLDVMNRWRNVGLFGHSINGYVSVNPRNTEHVTAAIHLFGSVNVGLSLPISMQNQNDIWTVTDRSLQGDSAPGSFGGHCCAGETKIPLLDGTTKTIKELYDSEAKDFWVYGCELDGTIVPCQVDKVLPVKISKTVTVTLDDGEQIKTTPDHKFMMRDGSYVEASKLKEGDSLMPLYKDYDDRGYEMVKHNYDNERWELTHHMVGKSMGIPRGGKFVTHHADFNKFNNTPTNLKSMTWDAHTELHRSIGWTLRNKTEKARKRSSELMSALWSDPVWRANRILKNGENGKNNIKSCNTREVISKRTETRKRNSITTKICNHCHTPFEIKKGHHRRKYCSSRCFYDHPFTEERKEVARQNAKKLNEIRWNHKVVSVVENLIEEQVYDLVNSTPTNNFCANGVFVHNCVVISEYDMITKEFVCITWGARQRLSFEFFTTYCDECYAALSNLWISGVGLSPGGFDLEALNTDLKAV